MAEGTLSHLDYGHAGTATFDADSREWSFARHFTPTTLKQIEIREPSAAELAAAPVQLPNSAVSTRLTDAKDNSHVIVRDHPQLVAAQDLLPELAITSAAIISTTSTYDPVVGSLYSTGSITFAGRSELSENPRRVAATVTGEAGNILCLGLLYKEILGWGKDDSSQQNTRLRRDQSVWLRADTLRNTECGYWNDGAAPIQQVCFAQTEDKSSLLAVRLLTKTVIFRPFYSQRPRPAKQSPYHKLPPSLVDAHPVLTLENEQSGGSPHADVTFNPDFQLQFAVVDQSQAWSVWDIEHGRKGNEYKLSCAVQGHITQSEDADLKGEDGWARILWVGDVNTIFVCNRRHASIVGIKGGSFEYLPCPTLISSRTSDWILDVKRHPSARGTFFVLTSTELVLMTVITVSEAVDANVGPVGARVLLSWRHYRGSEDFTLSMSVHMLDEDQSCVMLRSRLNNLTQTYTFNHHTSNTDAFNSSAMPTLLDLTTDLPSHTLEVVMEPCRYQGDTTSSETGLGRTYFARGLQFYKVFMLQSNLSVHESILYIVPPSNGHSEDETVANVTWTRIFRPRKDVRVANSDEMHNFIVPEGIEAMNKPISNLASPALESDEEESANRAPRLVDHRLVYDALTRKHDGGEIRATTIDVPTVTAQVRDSIVESANSSPPPLGTILEFAGMELGIPDVDEASASLQQLLHDEGRDKAVELRHIAAAHLLHLGTDEQPSIASLYDSMLETWIAPLTAEVPRRVRKHKERLARRIAAEVMLASTRALHRESQTTIFESQSQPSQDSGISMPILSSQPLPGSSSQWMSSQPPSSQPLSLLQPQPSLPPLSTPISSQTQMSSQSLPPPRHDIADPLARLSKHLKFKEDATPTLPIPENVNKLLAHWQSGVDPRLYDWRASERADRVDEIDESNQKELEKAHKRKARREKKQKRENELMRSKPSSQPFTFVQPPVFPRSSPGPLLGPMGSSQAPSQPFVHVPLPGTGSQSQQGFGPFVAQSQVEPGKFGGRPEKKKKKKGRVSGF